eukprot:6185494-Pleurochrysis_carterae.AAC.7
MLLDNIQFVPSWRMDCAGTAIREFRDVIDFVANLNTKPDVSAHSGPALWPTHHLRKPLPTICSASILPSTDQKKGLASAL